MTPGSTYRVQFHAGFTLRDAERIVPYLHALGVTHLYASPILAARPGSPHGYDVVDHARLNPEVGTEAELASLSAALNARGMGLILDIVPNHMCTGGENAWWVDVLEHGPASPFAAYFDIAWDDSPQPAMHGRLLLPILGEAYGTALESGQFVPAWDAGGFCVRLDDLRLPLDPRTYDRALVPAADAAKAVFGPDDPSAVELASILNAVRNLPSRRDADRAEDGRSECASIKRRLSELADRFPPAALALNESLALLVGTPGEPASFNRLDELLEAQAYRPCYWRVASDEINYRRFFDVNDLAALSTEHEDVFRAVHETWFRWVGAGIVDGLRVDHPDGLFDPKQYLDRLKSGRSEPLYVVVEKILGDGERLPADWACAGTTGYEFINAVNGLFVDPAGEKPLTELYRQFTGRTDPFAETAYKCKRLVSQSSLSSELNALAYQLDRLARLDRRSRDFTLNGLRKALREVIACFPVYRSYVNDTVHDTDKAVVGVAVARARRRNPLLGRAIFDFVRDTVLLKDSPSGSATDEYRDMQRRFAGKFQQVTAPVTAKGVEDTAFYVDVRLASLNEVGGEPSRFGWSPAEVHEFLATRMPGSLSPLSTHDTKRGEDVRARINVLSEMPGEWADTVSRWAVLNRRHKTTLDDRLVPDANEEYLLYQTLVGTWAGGVTDEYRKRIRQYMRKATAEAKVHTSWINPDAEYEAGVEAFTDAVLTSDEFVGELATFVGRVTAAGRVNSLAQTLIRCTAPGVPDTYQGTEGWDDSLVDPDNRRPVDYAIRERWLNDVGRVRPLADPRVKAFVLTTALRMRRDRAADFAGGYTPLSTTGDHADRAFAFARNDRVAVVVPRLTAGLRGWSNTTVSLPTGRWRDAFTGTVHASGGTVPVAEVFAGFPVSLLVREDE